MKGKKKQLYFRSRDVGKGKSLYYWDLPVGHQEETPI